MPIDICRRTLDVWVGKANVILIDSRRVAFNRAAHGINMQRKPVMTQTVAFRVHCVERAHEYELLARRDHGEQRETDPEHGESPNLEPGLHRHGVYL
jgi:hypothetical protein